MPLGCSANDVDPDGDSLSIYDFDYLAVMGIDLTLNPDGSFTLIPDDQLWENGQCGETSGIPYAIFDRQDYDID